MATAILPYLEKRKNDPREHREAAGFGGSKSKFDRLKYYLLLQVGKVSEY